MKRVSSSDTDGQQRAGNKQRNRVASALRAASGSLLSVSHMLDIHAGDDQRGCANNAPSSYKMMSSTAFPKVIFVRAPMVSPISMATLSVA